MSIYDVLEARGFAHACTDVDAFKEITSKKSVTVYCGFDPTGDSLTIGHMVSLMGLLHFQREGHRPLVVMGGATGMIGDPSGKSAERNLLTPEQINANLEGQRPQMERFLDFDGPHAAKILNNFDWIGPRTFIDFLRDVGKSFRMGEMLAKDSVRSRLDSEAGLSFTEFSYQLLQAYDFKYLYETEGCEVQVGGGDQWGNITAGLEYIRKTIAKPAFGLVFPLLMTASGQKMGKTESGAVYLDPKKTPVYDFYQYWVRADDRDVERFLKMFTLMPLEEIASVVAEHTAAPEKRTGQKRLAFEVTRFVHGEAEAAKARDAAEALYSDSLANLSDEKLQELFPEVPSIEIEMGAEGADLFDVLVQANLAPSKKMARTLLGQGGVYLNNAQLPADRKRLTREDLASDTMMILRAGKKRYCLVRVS